MMLLWNRAGFQNRLRNPWRFSMSSPSLSELLAQHAALEAELAEALAHPATSDAEIAAIKRKKLKLKDEIAQLQRTTHVAA
jgi:hypothetical protein